MSNKDYPRIIEIENDGKIIAKDKYNKLNTELNIHTLTYKQQEEVFGGILIKDNYEFQTERAKQYLEFLEVQ